MWGLRRALPRQVPDSEGGREWFPVPEVDSELCVGCGACTSVCPVTSACPQDACGSVWWARANDDELLGSSSSGGVFGLLANRVLSRGGVVAGAAWDPGCRSVSHRIVGDAGELDLIMRSKYVQSFVGREVYEGLRDALGGGLPVLFSGTACQVAGVRAYLGGLANSSDCLLVDVICHGVPSPGLWRGWIDYLEAREGARVGRVNHRNKTTGWSSSSVQYEYEAGEGSPGRVRLVPHSDDWYMRAFLRNASLRSSCFQCRFKRRCGSDLTLGDFWGVTCCHPEAFDDRGVSAVVASTVRGASALKSISSGLAFGPATIEEVAAGNTALSGCVIPHEDRAALLDALAAGMPVERMIRAWPFRPTLRRRLLAGARRIAKRLLGRWGQSGDGVRTQ